MASSTNTTTVLRMASIYQIHITLALTTSCGRYYTLTLLLFLSSTYSVFGAEKKGFAKSTVSHILTVNSILCFGQTVEVSCPHLNFRDFILIDL